jgi:hypothetical protein
MANIVSVLKAKVTNRLAEVYMFLQTYTFLTVNGLAANGDRIQLVEITRNMRVSESWLAVSGTLGASCTLQLQRDRAGVYTNMTVATTAAAASTVGSMTIGPIDLDVGDFVVALVGGAAVTAAATITVDLVGQTD